MLLLFKQEHPPPAETAESSLNTCRVGKLVPFPTPQIVYHLIQLSRIRHPAFYSTVRLTTSLRTLKLPKATPQGVNRPTGPPPAVCLRVPLIVNRLSRHKRSFPALSTLHIHPMISPFRPFCLFLLFLVLLFIAQILSSACFL